MKKIIIIGSGLSGSVCARLLSEKGYLVEIYEVKNHLGGHVYDYYRDNNILVHKYGPHIFHTNYDDV
jgi:UDP-galactopyranose mutase